MTVGIERIGVYAGAASIDLATMAAARGLDPKRFANLLMRRKSLSFRFEDPVSFAVNAAKPMVDALPDQVRQSIEVVIVATESGIDWGKSISNYVHEHLDLGRRCRSFEVKQACYGGTAALQTAAAMVASGQVRRGLVICTDLARCVPHSYAEPAQGCAAVAMLVGPDPEVLALEPGASGLHSYQVMDSCRPTADIETGDVDLSLLSYLDCVEKAFVAYRERVGEVSFQDHFAYLAWHTPFGGMVKGAHRTMMRRFQRVPPPVIEADFAARMQPALSFCQEVGNIYSGTVFLALAGVLAHGDFSAPRRVGLFSYGSGCSSEFYSGVAGSGGAEIVRGLGIGEALAARRALTMDEYDAVLAAERPSLFGERAATIDLAPYAAILREAFEGTGRLILTGIEGFQRKYRFV